MGVGSDVPHFIDLISANVWMSEKRGYRHMNVIKDYAMKFWRWTPQTIQ